MQIPAVFSFIFQLYSAIFCRSVLFVAGFRLTGKKQGLWQAKDKTKKSKCDQHVQHETKVFWKAKTFTLSHHIYMYLLNNMSNTRKNISLVSDNPKIPVHGDLLGRFIDLDTKIGFPHF